MFFVNYITHFSNFYFYSKAHSNNCQINIVESNEEINGSKDPYHRQISAGGASIESAGSTSLQELYVGLKSNGDIKPNNSS